MKKQLLWRTRAACALLGGLIFLAVYGVRVLDVTYDAWIFNGYIETDVTQHYAGWLAYRQAAHLFPLTFSEYISYPFGGYTSITDSIPLAEIFFKLLSPLLPETFQFYGILCLLDLILQGFSACLLLELFCPSPVQRILGSGLLCLSPVLLERMFRHVSLSPHYLLLLAIWLYFKGTRRPAPAIAAGFGGLCILSVWLHLYFTPMLVGFFLAYLLDGMRRLPRPALQWGCFAGALAGCLCSARVLGLLSIGTENNSGYGQLSMNLNALFNPVSLDSEWWVPGKGKLCWSLFLPVRALALDNLESFNYLGLGVLLGLVVAALLLVIHRLEALALFHRHLWLLLFAGFSTLFAVSCTVCAFSYVLFTVPLPQSVLQLCSAFRASGRLFWSVNYLLVLLCIVTVSRIKWKGKAVGTAALALLVAIQAVDLSPALAAKHSRFAVAETDTAQPAAAEVAALNPEAEVLYNLELRDDRAMCAAFLKLGLANNYQVISRGSYGVEQAQEDMDATRQALLAGEVPYRNAIYATTDPQLSQEILTAHPDWNSMELSGVWYLSGR